MGNRRNIALVALLLVGCSSPADDNTTTEPVNTTGAAPDVAEGLYADSEAEASLAVWGQDGDLGGTLILAGARGFSVNMGDVVTPAPLAGACDGCPDASWTLDVTRVGTSLSIAVAAHDGDGPGFGSLIMVPHDGFKPEFSPGPGVAVWTGRVVAASAEVSAAPVLDQNCEISVDLADDTIASFGCFGIDTESGWTAEIQDSWSIDETSVSFETSAARFDGGVSGDVLSGRVLLGDAAVGAFEFLKLTP